MRIDREGYKFFIYFALVTFFLGLFSYALLILGIILSIFCLFFFRDPEREIPNLNDVLVSPADGVVIQILENQVCKDVQSLTESKFTKISIFMNVFNVHVNRTVAAGIIDDIIYYPGKFFNASFDKASESNERNVVVLNVSQHNTSVIFIQIAGLIARRIRCDVNKGTVVKMGQKFGIIRFGSRLDVYMDPKIYEISVNIGKKVISGETVIARCK